MAVLSIISNRLPPAKVQEAYSEQLQAVGGVAPYVWTVVPGFGTLPSGMSLSSSGILSAAPGAIGPGQVATYQFRVKAVDAALSEIVQDCILDIVPVGFDKIPLFLLEEKYRDLIERGQLDQINRLKNERHFFRTLIGALGDTFAHLDEDIQVADWLVPGTDKTLREVLEALYAEAHFAIQSINTIEPVWPSRDFLLQEGSGVSIAPVVGGLRVDVDLSGLSEAEFKETAQSVVPGATAQLVLTSGKFTSQLWIESGGVEYPAGSFPDIAGKSIDQATAGNALLAMATGTDGSKEVLHVVCYDLSGTLLIERYDALTMEKEETAVLPFAGSGGILGAPCVVTQPISGDVFVTYVEAADGIVTLTNVLWHGQIDPSDYTTIPVPFQMSGLPPGYTDVYACEMESSGGSDRVIGTMTYGTDTNWYGVFALRGLTGGPAIHPFLVGFQQGLTPVVPIFSTKVATAEDTLDVAMDFSRNLILWLTSSGRGAGPGNLIMNFDSVPFAALTSTNLTALSDGYEVVQAAIQLDPAAISKDAAGVTYLWDPNYGSVVTTHDLYHVVITNLGSYPAVTVGTPFKIDREEDVEFPLQARFGKWWSQTGATSILFSTFVEPVITENAVYFRRTAFDVEGAIERADILLNSAILGAYGTTWSDYWIRTADTSYPTHAPRALAVIGSSNFVLAVDPYLKPHNIYVDYDPGTYTLTVHNKSPFTWDIRLTAIESTTHALPPNLLIACWQLAQALQRYVDDAGYYPSPSTNGANGTTWTELEFASEDVLGYKFEDYYSVTPGEYDLAGGATASAFYFSDAVAGSASHQALAFRYASYPTEITAAEAVVDAAISAYITNPPVLPVPSNGLFYTLAELDVLLGTSFATTYTGMPFDLYEYFCFRGAGGLVYHQGWFSRNYVVDSTAYGPAPDGVESVPVDQHWVMTSDATAGVPTEFILSQSVLDAHVLVNGIEYFKGIHWIFDGINKVKYLNDPSDYVLHTDDRVTVRKFVAV